MHFLTKRHYHATKTSVVIIRINVPVVIIIVVIGLQEMVRACECYGCLWHFSYDPIESRVTQFLGHMRNTVLPGVGMKKHGVVISKWWNPVHTWILHLRHGTLLVTVEQGAKKLVYVSG